MTRQDRLFEIYNTILKHGSISGPDLRAAIIRAYGVIPLTADSYIQALQDGIVDTKGNTCLIACNYGLVYKVYIKYKGDADADLTQV